MTLTGVGICFGSIYQANEFLQLHALATLLLLGFSLFVGYVHGMRWIDRKGVIVGSYVVTIILALAFVGHASLTRSDIAERNDVERAAATQAAAKAQASAAAQRDAEAKCLSARSSAIENATQRKSIARAAVKKCRQDFEDNKPLFSTETAETHCRLHRGALAEARGALERAEAIVCAPSATGTVEQHR